METIANKPRLSCRSIDGISIVVPAGAVTVSVAVAVTVGLPGGGALHDLVHCAFASHGIASSSTKHIDTHMPTLLEVFIRCL